MVEEQSIENGNEIPLSSPSNSNSIELWSPEDFDNSNSGDSSQLFLSTDNSSSEDQAKTLSDFELSSQGGEKKGDYDDKKETSKGDMNLKTEIVSNSNKESLPPKATSEPSKKDSQDDQLEVAEPPDARSELRNSLSLSSIMSQKVPEAVPQQCQMRQNRRKSKYSKLKTASTLYNLKSISLYGTCKQSDFEKPSAISEVDKSPDHCDEGIVENSVKNSQLSQESSKINNISDRNSNVSDRNSNVSDLPIGEARHKCEKSAQQGDVLINNVELDEIKEKNEDKLKNFDDLRVEKTKELNSVSAELESKNSFSPVSEKNAVKNITSKKLKKSLYKNKTAITSDNNHDNVALQQNEGDKDKPMALKKSGSLIQRIKDRVFSRESEKNYEDNKILGEKAVNTKHSERNNEKKDKNVKPLISNENIVDMVDKTNNCEEIDENKKVDKKVKIKNAKRKMDNIKYGKRVKSIKFEEIETAPSEMIFDSLDFILIGDDANKDQKNHNIDEYTTMADISYSLNYLNFLKVTLYLLETQKTYLDHLQNILTDISILPKSKTLIVDSKKNIGDVPSTKSSSSKSTIGVKLSESFKSISSISNPLIEILPKLIDKFKKKLYILKSHKFVALLKDKLDSADFFSGINEYNLSLIKLTSALNQNKSAFKFQINSKTLSRLNETPEFAPNTKHEIHLNRDKEQNSERLKELTRLQYKFTLPHSSSHFNILFVHQSLMDNFSVMLKSVKDHRGAANPSQAFIDIMDDLRDKMKINFFKSSASLNFFIASISGSVTLKGSKSIQNAMIFYTFHNLFILDCSKIGNIFDKTGEKGKGIGNNLGKLVFCETFANLNKPYLPAVETKNKVNLKKQADIISQFYRTTNPQIKHAKYLEISEITRKFQYIFEAVSENSKSFEFTIECSKKSDLDLLIDTIKFNKAHNTKSLFDKSELESCAKHFIPTSLEYSTLRHFHKLKKLISNSRGVGCHTESDMQGWLRVRIYPVQKNIAKVLDLDSSQYKCCLVNRFLMDKILVSNCIDLPEKSKKSSIYSLQSFFINFNNENHIFLRVFDSTENNAIDFPIDFESITPFVPMKMQVAAEANEYQNLIMKLQITYYPYAMIEPAEAKEIEKHQHQEINQKQDLKLRRRNSEKDNNRLHKTNLYILHSILLHIENEPGTEFLYRRATNSKQELTAIKKVFEGNNTVQYFTYCAHNYLF
ncbi:MAG: hypothetical protein MHMPM18_000659 [Marteilia pararefringens]